MTNHTIGVDISKSHLDVFHLDEQRVQRFDNTQAGLRALQKWLGAGPLARVVYEPTGPYHRLFEESLAGKFPLVQVPACEGEPVAGATVCRSLRNPREDRCASMPAVWPAWGGR